MMRFSPFLLALATVLLPLEGEAFTKLDAKIVAKTLNFSRHIDTGQKEIPVAVLYDSADDASRNEAREVAEQLNEPALRSKKGPLQATPVSLEAYTDSGLKAYKAAYITRGAIDGFREGRREETGVLTLGTHIPCVQEGVCIIGIRSAPSIQILLNQDAMEAAGIDFAAAFKFMIKKVR